MKTPLLVVLLALSLAANAAFYLQRSGSADATGSSSARGEKTVAVAKAGTVASRNSEEKVATEVEAARMAQVWTGLQNSDLPTLVAQLRAAGFSPAMIRAIVAARVNEQFSARRKALLAQQEDQPFWRMGPQTWDPKTLSGMRELGREQSEMMKQLLGADSSSDSDERQAFQRRQFGDLPKDKLDQIQSIISDYSDLRAQVYSAANGVMLSEDREKMTLLEKEQRADLASLLTPQELENYELRSSSTASSLRSQLALFKPTEEEFRALFKLQQAFDERYGSANTITSAEQFRQRQARQQEMVAEVKNVLSPDRLAAYQQAIDPAYQTINRLAARLELPASTASQVVAVQQDITKRASAVHRDKSLTAELRNLQLAALEQEATAKLNVALGSRGLEAYKQYGGQWVQNLNPRQGTPRATQ